MKAIVFSFPSLDGFLRCVVVDSFHSNTQNSEISV